MKYASKAGKVK